jgi:hypothetical protein
LDLCKRLGSWRSGRHPGDNHENRELTRAAGPARPAATSSPPSRPAPWRRAPPSLSPPPDRGASAARRPAILPLGPLCADDQGHDLGGVGAGDKGQVRDRVRLTVPIRPGRGTCPPDKSYDGMWDRIGVENVLNASKADLHAFSDQGRGDGPERYPLGPHGAHPLDGGLLSRIGDQLTPLADVEAERRLATR